MPFIDEHGLVEMTTAGYLTRARLLRLDGDMAAADACLLEGESLGHPGLLLRAWRASSRRSAAPCACRPARSTRHTSSAQSYGLVGPAATAAVDEDDKRLPVHAAAAAARLQQGASPAGALNDAILRRAQRDGHQACSLRGCWQ